MTGIERLREFAGGIRPTAVAWVITSKQYDEEHPETSDASLRRLLADIADQIERETQPKSDPAADVSVSAYDLLPEDEREAVAWVREHGGIAYVKDAWNVRSNLDRQLEREQAKVARQQRHIEFVQRKCRERQEHICELNKLKRAYIDALNGVCKRLCLTDGTGLPDMAEVIWTELDRRLMPEGMEWLLDAWPKFEDDAPVKFGDKVPTIQRVTKIGLFSDRSYTLYNGFDSVPYKPGERVKRPASKVLAADGKPLREGETVWYLDHIDPLEVRSVSNTSSCGS